jgi:hypothetical protein
LTRSFNTADRRQRQPRRALLLVDTDIDCATGAAAPRSTVMLKVERRSTPPSRRAIPAKQALTAISAATFAVCAAVAQPATAVGSLAAVDIVVRGDSRALATISAQGRNWVVGTPGKEYAVRVCNSTDARILAVTSVDGVNVISGDTAAPDQTGYVLDPHGCLDIAGWRKSLARAAAFYFTELPDSYAARTGRPDNVGVVGVAVFREKPAPVVWRPTAKMAAEARRDAPAAGSPEPPAAPAAADSSRAREGAGALATPIQSQLGTGHGRSEVSHARQVSFERDSVSPAETIAIHYDRRENLVAMGILPPPVAQSRPPTPFPGAVSFAPDPPTR